MIETRWPGIEITKTTAWEERDPPGERLASYEALVSWSVSEGLLGAGEAAALETAAAADPAGAARVLAQARRLRGVLYRIFTAVAAARAGGGEVVDQRSMGGGGRVRGAVGAGGAGEVADEDLAALNSAIEAANARRRLVREGDGFGWGWDTGAPELERVLWPVVCSAAELLTSEALERVRLCDAHDCGWLFIDASRNRSRRWCDMAECGNREKLRRYRARQRATDSERAPGRERGDGRGRRRRGVRR